jgi:hypothetical protein
LLKIGQGGLKTPAKMSRLPFSKPYFPLIASSVIDKIKHLSYYTLWWALAAKKSFFERGRPWSREKTAFYGGLSGTSSLYAPR